MKFFRCYEVCMHVCSQLLSINKSNHDCEVFGICEVFLSSWIRTTLNLGVAKLVCTYSVCKYNFATVKF